MKIMDKNCWAILLAAGNGSRFKSSENDLPKQFLLFKNKPLYWHSAQKLAASGIFAGMIFVFPEQYFAHHVSKLNELCENDTLGIPWNAVKGGETRRDSVREGLLQLPPATSFVIIHDSARPFFHTSIIFEIYKKLVSGFCAIIPGVPVTDTIKTVRQEQPDKVEKTLPRKKLISVQTPQGFCLKPLLQAHNQFRFNNEITDDAMLMEYAGHEVIVIPGNEENIKITNPKDKILLQNTKSKEVPCSGFGYDVHRYGEGHLFKLGGIEIPSTYRIVSHSDGDVLLHALIDAILGCAGLKDIGEHFPDSDLKYKDISSSFLLQQVLNMVEEKIRIYHVDVTIVAQKPHLGNFKDCICKNVAKLINLDPINVNVKATTEEGLGYTGALEGIKVYALVNAWKKIDNLP